VIAPDSKRQAFRQAVGALDVSEHRACQVIGQPRYTQRYEKQVLDDEALLRQRIIELASEYAVMVTLGSQSSCGIKVGSLNTSVCSVFGGKKG